MNPLSLSPLQLGEGAGQRCESKRQLNNYPLLALWAKHKKVIKRTDVQ